jgi:hypothetical protein
MADERPLLTLQHPTTRRWAVFEDDGTSGWLLVTEPDVPKPVGDCFVYNCRRPAKELPRSWDGSGQPPITKPFASATAHWPGGSLDRIRLTWTRGGSAAVVLMDDEPVAFLVVGEERGYSRGIAVDGPYGHPWSDERFAEVCRERRRAKPSRSTKSTRKSPPPRRGGQ